MSLIETSILLVDDREENLISLAAILEQPGYRLVRAHSGQEALKALLAEDFALILLDVQMPGMDGFETASLIKQRERSRNIPIIFLTAFGREDEPLVFRGYQAGAVDYITKPFEPTVLRSKVAVFADLHRKTVALFRTAQLERDNERLELERTLARVELEAVRRERASAQRYQDLLEGIRHGFVWTMECETGRITFVSSRAVDILGRPIGSWFAEPGALSQIVHADDRSHVLSQLEAAGSGHNYVDGMPAVIEHRFVRADGEARWFQTSLRREPREEGNGHEIRALSVDITGIKLAEQAALEAVRVRDDFLSIASHELKTPLTALRLKLQMLRRMAKSQEATASGAPFVDKVRENLQASDRQVERLTRLVDELLDVARISNGQLTLEHESVDLGEIVREICTRFDGQLASAGCTLQVELDESVGGIWDRLRVEQVFINLLSNAIKYGPGGPIQVWVRKEGEIAVLAVKDHGIGIPESARARIFRQFERAVSPAHFGGLGLGLFIVRQILQAHGGSIEVESIEGNGSTFTVRLPLDAKDVPTGIRTDESSSIEEIREA